MKTRQGVTVVAGLLLLFVPLSAGAQQLPAVACPDLSQLEPAANKVAVDVAEALKPSGVVCVRIKNEGKKAIQVSRGGVQLQIWEKRGKKNQFQAYENVLKKQLALADGETFGIEREGTFAVGKGIVIAEHGTLNLVLPSNTLPVRPGMYRVCLSYTPLGREKFARRCSPVVPVSSSLSNCPLLPVQPPSRGVSLHVAKAVDMPGVVCARVINGLASPITFGGRDALWLQRWDKDHWEKRDYASESVLTLPSGETIPVMSASPAYELSEGKSEDRYLRYFGKPAPPGKYRACFTFLPPNREDQETLCSRALFLP